MTDRAGQQLGHYRLLRLLGRGGFADVYLGEHIHLNTLAAIKVLDARLSSEEVEQFRSEARTIARLEHPNIVRVLDFGVEETVPFLVMSYAPNGSLRQLHPRGTRLPLATVCSYVNQVAAALYYAHSEHLIHRDVKPENMLLGRNHEVLLSDFGLAMVPLSSSENGPRDSAGTIAYMAPEQARGKPRPASDQYALAITAYEWLCGTRPFTGSYEEIAVQHVLSAPPPLSQYAPGLPSSVETAILKALAKDPHERFPSIKDFAQALEQASQGNTWLGSLNMTSSEQSSSGSGTRGDSQSAPDRVSTPAIYAVAWSPGRRHIATGGHDRIVNVWDLTVNAVSLIYRSHAAGITALAWSPDGRRIASASLDKTVQVWDTVDGQRIATYDRHTGMIYTVSWSPDGTLIASTSGGGSEKVVQVWDAATGAQVYTYTGHPYWARAAAWSPDGKLIASGSLKEVQVWRAADGHRLASFRGHEGWVRTLAWSPDGKRIASTSEDKAVQVWDAARGRLIHSHHGHSDWIISLAWSPDGTRVASVSKDAIVQVWCADSSQNATDQRSSASGDTLTFHARPFTTYAITWLPDGKHIALACGDGSVQLWQAT